MNEFRRKEIATLEAAIDQKKADIRMWAILARKANDEIVSEREVIRLLKAPK